MISAKGEPWDKEEGHLTPLANQRRLGSQGRNAIWECYKGWDHSPDPGPGLVQGHDNLEQGKEAPSLQERSRQLGTSLWVEIHA